MTFPDFEAPANPQQFISELLIARKAALAMTRIQLEVIECLVNPKAPDGQPTQDQCVGGRLTKDNFQISLTNKIQYEVDQPQVFAAHLTLSESNSEEDVILKLFQQSFLTIPEVDDVLDSNKNGWMPATDIAQKEAWAYMRLLALQGSIVPHSYGFFLVSQGELD